MTVGDPGGIGPDIVIRAWLDRNDRRRPPFYVLADPAQVAARAKTLGHRLPVMEVRPEDAGQAFARALPVVPLESRFVETTGRSDPRNARGIVEAVERAVRHCFDGLAGAVVTAPIAKKSLYESGFAYPGHTEFLGHLAAKETGRRWLPVMMLAGPSLRTVPVTIHVPLSEVPKILDTESIVSTCRVVADDLHRRFGISRPRLAVAGLNPHAGEGGTMGREDIEVIGPAVSALRASGIDAFGPLPADTMFHEAALATYDAAVCMYHDQALIPVKTLAFDHTVNVTLGLPFIRTSPDHGTAFDLAGTGRARPDSMAAALALAARLHANGCGADAR